MTELDLNNAKAVIYTGKDNLEFKTGDKFVYDKKSEVYECKKDEYVKTMEVKDYGVCFQSNNECIYITKDYILENLDKFKVESEDKQTENKKDDDKGVKKNDNVSHKEDLNKINNIFDDINSMFRTVDNELASLKDTIQNLFILH